MPCCVVRCLLHSQVWWLCLLLSAAAAMLSGLALVLCQYCLSLLYLVSVLLCCLRRIVSLRQRWLSRLRLVWLNRLLWCRQCLNLTCFVQAGLCLACFAVMVLVVLVLEQQAHRLLFVFHLAHQGLHLPRRLQGRLHRLCRQLRCRYSGQLCHRHRMFLPAVVLVRSPEQVVLLAGQVEWLLVRLRHPEWTRRVSAIRRIRR